MIFYYYDSTFSSLTHLFGLLWMCVCAHLLVFVYWPLISFHLTVLGFLFLLFFLLQFASSQKFTFAKDTRFPLSFVTHACCLLAHFFSRWLVRSLMQSLAYTKHGHNRFANGKPLRTKSPISNSIDDFILLVPVIIFHELIAIGILFCCPCIRYTDAICVSFPFILFIIIFQMHICKRCLLNY